MTKANFNGSTRKSSRLFDLNCKAASASMTMQAIFAKKYPPGTQRKYEKLADFGKELFYRGYTYDKFINDLICVTNPNNGDTAGVKNTIGSLEDFVKRFSDFDTVISEKMMREVATSEELKNLIKGGYDYAINNPNGKLVYFGKELFYRGSEKDILWMILKMT